MKCLKLLVHSTTYVSPVLEADKKLEIDKGPRA